jgi:hypothetical protein
MPVGLSQIRTSDVTKCSLRFASSLFLLIAYVLSCPLQNLQQSRGFGNNFKFPEGDGQAPEAAATGNAGFADDAADDDLYA